MKDYRAEGIRNIVVIGHGSEGKTTLLEAMLFATGVVDRQGRVEDGNTVSDFDAEETRRHISISADVVPVEFAKKKLNFIDVPGYFDFFGEMMGPLRAAEGAMIVVGAPSGVAVGTEKAWAQAEKHKLAKFFAVNQMDREHVDFDKVLAALRDKFGSSVVPLILPIGQGPALKGVVDIVAMKAFEGAGKTLKEVPIPADMQSAVDDAREIVKEAAAGTSEALMEKFFEEGELTDEELLTGLSAGILDGSLVPVAPVSSLTGVGISPLMFALAAYMPSPAGRRFAGTDPKSGAEAERAVADDQPFSAQVFKTLADPFVGKLSLLKVLSGALAGGSQIYNPNADKQEKVSSVFLLRGKKQTSADALYAGDIGALAKLQYTNTGDTLCDPAKPIQYPSIAFPQPSISMAVSAKKAGEEDKVFSGLARLQEEDPSITLGKSAETLETLLNGQGELHLEVVRAKLAGKFGVEAVLKDPRIPYRETIRKTIQAEGRHKKQTGGHGQFGHVKIEFSPIGEGSTDFEFVDAVVGGVVPRNFIPSVEKGLRENLPKGVLAGYPMVGLRAKLYDGSYHPVDSSEMAFKTAARIAYKKCVDASPVLLEPIYHVEVLVPDEYMGDIIGDINKRRGRILGMNQVDGLQQVVAEAPLAEMFKYATDLRSMTQARGSFTMTYERYEEVPSMVATKIIETHKSADEDEDEE
ncbi:MAG: elongation factor G [Oscillospiraceae bacterium]|jgi:elongation factor G|nr:elongation factor G [Oscillospiraceae bacterium]